MPDFFGSIAAAKQERSRLPLITPAPAEKSGKLFEIVECDGKVTPVYKKMDSKAELDAEISRLKEKYASFRKRVAPKTNNTRTRKYLSTFTYALDGGTPKEVAVPHYDGPVGKHKAIYETAFIINNIEDERTIFLHFDGVDYICDVFVNDAYVGSHEGFFGAFEFDITEYVKPGENKLAVVCKNDFIYMGNATPDNESERIEGDKLYAATGPGYDDPEWGWHHCPPGFGIYQKVYVEERPEFFISDIFVRPIPEKNEFEIMTTVFSTKTLPPDSFSLSYTVCGSNFYENLIDNFEYEPFTFTNDANGYTVNEYDWERFIEYADKYLK